MRRAIIPVLLAITALSMIASNYVAFRPDFVGPGHRAHLAKRISRDLIDVPPLLLRTSQCSTFIQTRSYWHENYTPNVPFYRPLTLTWFWLEFHILGDYDYRGWILVSIFLQFSFSALFGLFVKKLTGSSALAFCTLIIFAGERTWLPTFISDLFLGTGYAPAVTATLAWKDQATQLADIAVVAALLCAAYEKWLPGLAAAVMAVLFKESGWITYALVIALLAVTGKLSAVPRWVYPAAIVCILLPIISRTLSGMGPIGGENIGSNRHWLIRYLLAIGGPYLVICWDGRWAAALLGSALYSVIRWRQRSLIVKLCAALAAFVTAAFLSSWQTGNALIINAVILVDPNSELYAVIICFLYTAGLDWLMIDKEMRAIALKTLPMMLIATLPFAGAAQVGLRALNLSYAFQSLVMAAACISGFRLVRSHVNLLIERTKPVTAVVN